MGSKSSSGNKGSYAKVTPPVTLTVLKLISKNYYAKQIADELKKSKTTVHRHIERLKKWGHIHEDVRSTCKIYIITERGKTAIKENKLPETSYISTRMRLGTHLRVYIPVLKEGRVPDGFWTTINTRFKNSVIKHKDISHYIDGTSVKGTSRGIEIAIKHREIPTIKQMLPLVTRSVFWAVGFFSGYGYKLDVMNFYVNDIHNTIWTKETGEVAEKSGKFIVAFPWNRKKITPRDPDQQAKAWFDRTPEPNLETNDIGYEEAFIRMPIVVGQNAETISKLTEQMAIYAKHLNAHIPVLRGMEKLIKKLDRRISQRKLGEFA